MSVASSSTVQPPPRKGNYLKVLRNLHTEQLSKVQWKHQQECELLEDLRNFIKQRCAAEKSYGEAMQKISANYLNKKMPPIHELNHDQSQQQWTVWSIWRSLLEETDKLAKAKLAAVDVLQQQIGDDVKIVRQNKLQLAKKNLDLLKVVQSEVQTCVTELDKLKKVYVDDEHVSHDARDKAREAEEKLKKKKGSIFQSVSSLQKTSAKLGSRRDLCEEKSTSARNAYLLQLASANAHQNRYFHVDLQNVVKTLDGGMYEKVAEYFSILSRTELITCSASTTSFGKIKEQSQTINRDYDLACFVDAFPILNQHITYEFEPCDNDSINTVDPSHGTLNGLMTSGRQYAQRVVGENKKIRESVRTLQALHTMRDSGLKTDPNDPTGPDLEAKIDDLKNQIRRSETARDKAEARLECLRQGGVKVDEFLQDAEGLAALGLMRSSSQLSFRESGQEDSDYAADSTSPSSRSRGSSVKGNKNKSHEAPLPQQPAQEYQDDSDDEFNNVDEGEQAAAIDQIAEMRAMAATAAAAWQDPAAAWDAAEVTVPSKELEVAVEVPVSSAAPSNYDGDVVKCIAFYPYTAQNADELSMMENEELEVLLAFSEGDGWVKARNYKGEEGYVPENYLDLHHADEPDSTSVGVHVEETAAVIEPVPEEEEEESGLEPQISFSSVDYTCYQQSGEGEEEAALDAELAGYPPKQNGHHPAPEHPSLAGLTVLGYCRALYDYDSTVDEELTFYEGEIIAILRRSGVSHGGEEDVDDGWWEGVLLPDGPQGVFPSLVVEECGPNGEELTPVASPLDGEDMEDDEVGVSGAPPPPGTPPVVPTFLLPPSCVIITQPTPDTEHMPNQDMFDQNATIKEEEELDGQEDDHSDVVNIQPATPTEESQTDTSFNANSPQQNGVDESEGKTNEEVCENKKDTEDEVMEPPPEPAPADDCKVKEATSATATTDESASNKFEDDFVTLESSAKESYA